MIEYRIEIPSKLGTVKILWKKFFQNDNTWHFTLEGTYIEIRVASRMPALEKYLESKKWQYTRFPYEDNIPITRKYQRQFEKIFHGYADLSMNTKREDNDYILTSSDISQLFERCVHLFFNVFSVPTSDEPRILSGLSIGRAYSAGYYQAIGEAQQTNQEAEENKKIMKKISKKKNGRS